MNKATSISNSSSTPSKLGSLSGQLSPAEQALKDRIDQFNQLPEIQREDLVDKYLDVHQTAAIIKSAVAIVKDREERGVIDPDTKQQVTAKIKDTSHQLVDQASDFLSACHSYKNQNNESINPTNS